jgi:hypothetical protein
MLKQVFKADERKIIATVPKAEEKLKEAILAKIQKCCVEMITGECSKAR